MVCAKKEDSDCVDAQAEIFHCSNIRKASFHATPAIYYILWITLH